MLNIIITVGFTSPEYLFLNGDAEEVVHASIGYSLLLLQKNFHMRELRRTNMPDVDIVFNNCKTLH